MPEKLETLDSKAWRSNGEKNSYHEYICDNVKLWRYEDMGFILVWEPEESLHFALPVKYMNYESIQYAKEYKKIMLQHRKRKDLANEEYMCGFSRKDELMTVVTLGIYLGENKWSAATRLSEITNLNRIPMEIRDEIIPFCNQFHANLLDINLLETSEIFMTDVREVLGFLMRQADKKALQKYVEKNDNFRHLKEDAYEVIAAYSNSAELEIRKQEYDMEEGFDMCLAIKEMIADGKADGRAQINRLVWQLLEEERMDDLLQSLRDREYQEKLLEEYGICDEI